jgi:hypothetical protein
MAKIDDSSPKPEVEMDKLTDLEKHLYRDYKEDLDAHDENIVDFDAFEAMHQGKTYDTVSKKTSNGLTDNMTATIYLERAARVAGQLPDGEVQAFGKKDRGKGFFMDLLRQKWIYPNANAQRAFKTKMFMWQYGSSEYGYMPMYYDLNVSPTGYFGPDCWLWNPRMFIPQNGFTSVPDMDYVHALANKSPKFFQDILDDDQDDTWDKAAIKDVIEQIKNASKKSTDNKRDTLRNQTKNNLPRQVTIATRYEAGEKGKWISFLPDFGYKVIRNIKNPHKNSRIPFVIKPCIPTFDSFYNIGDFQRSMAMQFANDGLDNFYFQGIKINLFPATVIDATNAVRHTISPDPGAIWEFTGTPNVKRLETSTAGLSTYQNAKGMAKGAIQSIAGTTDTRQNSEDTSDPGFGKTPEALKMIGNREATRDSQDRELLEAAMTELIDGMMSLIPTIKEKIPIDLFSGEIADIIKAGHTDLLEIFTVTKKTGLLDFRMSDSKEQIRLRIDPQKLQGLEYRFELKPNSTAKKTKEGQLQALLDFWTFIGKMPNALQQYQQATGKVPDWEKIFGRFGELADIDGMDELFTTPQQAAADLATGSDTPDTPPADPSVAPPVDPATGQPLAQPQVDPATGQPVAPAAPQTPVAPVAPAPATPVVPTHPKTGEPMVVLGQVFTHPDLFERAKAIEALASVSV